MEEILNRNSSAPSKTSFVEPRFCNLAAIFVKKCVYQHLQIRDLQIPDPQIQDLQIQDPQIQDLQIRDPQIQDLEHQVQVSYENIFGFQKFQGNLLLYFYFMIAIKPLISINIITQNTGTGSWGDFLGQVVGAIANNVGQTSVSSTNSGSISSSSSSSSIPVLKSCTYLLQSLPAQILSLMIMVPKLYFL